MSTSAKSPSNPTSVEPSSSGLNTQTAPLEQSEKTTVELPKATKKSEETPKKTEAKESIPKNAPITTPEPREEPLEPKLRKTRKFSEHPQKSLLRRLNARFPWLKIALPITLVLFVVLDLASITTPKTSNPPVVALISPMLKHVRITERDLTGKMLVALTFDDGPSSATTPELLDILKQKQVPATFFMLGNLARNNPNIVERAAAEGHEIATHTTSHQNLIRISSSAARADIAEAISIMQDILGYSPAYLRPPYGNYNDAVSDAAGVPIILWSVDTLDWKYRNTESIVDITLSEISDGGIILMHDVHPTSVEAVPTLIDAVRKAGYEFVTISELASLHGKTLTPGVGYYDIKP